MDIKIENATKDQAPIIATMIMEAMNHECCKWFAGENKTLEDFHRLMTKLVEDTNSQYSFKNTLIATNGQKEVIGVCVSYDGGNLHQLRQGFIEGALKEFGKDYSDMDDETTQGELYIDSLCVSKTHRKKGIATKLLKATIEKGKKLGLPAGLLVDEGNPKAEKLYKAIGFIYKDNNKWGGHNMRHLVLPII